MPPNPERQAKLAARREAMANDPALRDAQDAASAAVLGGYEKPTVRSITDDAAPAPRPMLPNYYAKGGQVGRVGTFGLKRSKPDFAGGGGRQNFKSWSKKNG
jgi:hypothetical protein